MNDGATVTISSSCGMSTTTRVGLLVTRAVAGTSAPRSPKTQVSVASKSWTCTSYDDRGRSTSVTVPACIGAPARTVNTRTLN